MRRLTIAPARPTTVRACEELHIVGGMCGSYLWLQYMTVTPSLWHRAVGKPYMCRHTSCGCARRARCRGQRRNGRPCVRGLRISVGDVLGWLAAGMTHEQILSDYPELTEEDIRACLAYAADRERRLVTAAQ